MPDFFIFIPTASSTGFLPSSSLEGTSIVTSSGFTSLPFMAYISNASISLFESLLSSDSVIFGVLSTSAMLTGFNTDLTTLTSSLGVSIGARGSKFGQCLSPLSLALKF